MREQKKRIFLIRHGETPWTITGQHTGLTDIDLTPMGEEQAKAIGKRLEGHPFALILCSPLKRAAHTCELAGMSKHAQLEPGLMEWNYGKYEGLTSQEITSKDPEWTIFTKGAPNGESIADISARADRLLTRLSSVNGDIALFSHGHFLRVLAARWLKLNPSEGRLFALSPSSLSILGYERQSPVLNLWNDTSHVKNIS